MRKIYLAGLVACLFVLISSVANAQRNFNHSFSKNKKIASTTNSVLSSTTADCDTVNYPINESWSNVEYASDPYGYVLGNNAFEDLQKANYFDLSSTANTYILGLRLYFSTANTSVAGNLSKTVIFRIYNDNSGNPGTQIGSVSAPLSDIQPTANGYPFDINFSSPIAMPSSKKFYASVDVSNLVWDTDSLSLYSTIDEEVSPGIAWEQWSDGVWHKVADAWANGTDKLNVAAYIFPIVSTSSTGCSVLPVSLLSFNAQRINKDVKLTWQIADEMNMKGYELQRADNNGSFKTVQSITALNYAKNQSYTVTDKNAFAAASTVQYRLKQIDGDGSVKYSRVISVKANAIISDISFANPFNGALKLQLNLATAQNISVQVYDMQGKAVVSQLNKMYNASSNSIVLDGTSSLKPGMYILKINAGTEQIQYKIIKQ